MLINDIHTFVKFLKNQGQNIYHTPEQIDDVINRACLDLFRQEEKVFESEQIITDTLGALKEKYIPTLSTNGVYSLPNNYVRMTNIAFDFDSITETPYLQGDAFAFCDPNYVEPTISGVQNSGLEHPIDLLIDSEWVNRQKNVFLTITESHPICRIYGRSLEVLPRTIVPIMYYLKYPTKGVWAYTISGDGYSTIFDELNSVDVDFPEIVGST